MNELHYYQCQNCLEIGTSPETFERKYETGLPYIEGLHYVNAGCGACDVGTMMHLGYVRPDAKKLERDVRVSACDGRCTSATGPICHCTCGCANHGTGRLVTVVRTVGAVPKLVPSIDKHIARTRGWEFKQAVEQAETLDKSNNNGRGSYTCLSAVRKAKRSTRHHIRMKLVTDFISSCGTTFTYQEPAEIIELDWRPMELTPEDHYYAMMA